MDLIVRETSLVSSKYTASEAYKGLRRARNLWLNKAAAAV